MSKLISYITMGAGMLILLIGIDFLKIKIPFLSGENQIIISIIGAGITIVGAYLLSRESGPKRYKHKLSEAEVPIYEGKGKKRRVVGYSRD